VDECRSPTLNKTKKKYDILALGLRGPTCLVYRLGSDLTIYEFVRNSMTQLTLHGLMVPFDWLGASQVFNFLG